MLLCGETLPNNADWDCFKTQILQEILRTQNLHRVEHCDLWDLIFAVLGNTNQSHKEQGDLLMNKRQVRSPPHTIQKRKHSQRMINDLDNVDFIPSNVNSSRREALLYVFEDNEAVIKMIIKGRSPTMKHVSRTHRVALDWLFDRINLDPKNPNQIH